MKWMIAPALAVFSLSLIACVGDDEAVTSSGGGTSSGDPTNTPQTNDFDIDKVEAAPLVQGQSVQVSVTINRAAGFQGPVSVAASSLPANVSGAPLVIPAGANEGKLTLNATAAAPQGVANVSITASDAEGKKTHTKPLALLVRGPAGSLDTTFGNGTGKVVVDTAVSSLWGISAQADGKPILTIDSEGDFVLYRLNADGTPDAPFGNTARAVADLREGSNATTDSPRGAAVSPDGTIFVAGYTTQPSSKYALARFTTAGKLDTAFNSTGFLFSEYAPNPDYLGNVLANGVATQSDGKPVLAAQIMNKANNNYDSLVLIRFKQNGAVDETFSGGFPTNHSSDMAANEVCASVAVADDGKIVCAGSSDLPGTGARMVAWRVDGNGANDTSFHAGDGVVVVPSASAPNARAAAVHTLSQGRVLMVGSSTADMAKYKVAIAQLTSAGTPDGSFAGSGIVSFDWGTPLQGGREPRSAVDAQGRIVVVAATGNDDAIGVARFNANGAPDESFAPGGKMVKPLEQAGGQRVYVAHAPDGRILLASTMGPPATPKAVVFRLWP